MVLAKLENVSFSLGVGWGLVGDALFILFNLNFRFVDKIIKRKHSLKVIEIITMQKISRNNTLTNV